MIMLIKIISSVTVLAVVVLAIVIQTTDPSSIGPVGLLAVFFLFYVFLLGLTSLFLWFISQALSKLVRPFTAKKPLEALSFLHAYYFSSIIALGPVMMLALQSIGSLGFYEIALVLIFLGVGILYVAKRIQ